MLLSQADDGTSEPCPQPGRRVRRARLGGVGCCLCLAVSISVVALVPIWIVTDPFVFLVYRSRSDVIHSATVNAQFEDGGRFKMISIYFRNRGFHVGLGGRLFGLK
jgi:hypothetical protein